MKTPFLLLILYLSFNLSQGGLIQDVEINSAMYVGVPVTSLAFILSDFDNLIPPAGNIRITFPFSFLLPSQITFVAVSGINENAVASVVNNQIIISNGYPYSQNTIRFALWKGTNMINGITALTNNTGPLTIESTTSNGQVIDSNNNVMLDVSLSPLRSMSFVSLNPNTNAQSTLVIEFNVSVQVLPMTSIKVKFPIWNPMAPLPFQSNILNRFEDCTSNTGEALVLDCEYQDGWLTVHNAFPLGAPANTTYSFRVKEIRNPHSLAPLVGFEIYLFNDENYFQELKDGVLTVTKPSPPRWVNFTNLNKAVSALTEISFEIFPEGFVNPDSSFLLGLPDNLNIDDPFQVIGQKNMKLGLIDFILFEKTLVLDKVFEAYLENDSFMFSIQNVRNGDDVIKHETFQLSILDENYFTMNLDLANVRYETTNEIYILNLTIENATVSTLTTYYIELGFDLIPNQGDLEIYFPSQTSLAFATNNSCNVLSGVNFGASCAIEGNKVTFFQAFPIISSDGIASIAVENVLNPVSTTPTEPFYVQVIINDQPMQNYSGNLSVEATPSEILIKEIYFTEEIVERRTSLVIYFEAFSMIPINSVIELTMENILLGEVSCHGLVNIEKDTSCQSNDKTVIIQNGLLEGKIGETLFGLVINNLTTPRVTQPICGITITIKDENNGKILTTKTDFCVNSPKPASLSSEIRPLINIMGLEASYSFRLIFPHSVEEGDTLNIRLPDELTINLARTQASLVSPYQQNLDTTFTENNINITFTNSITISEPLILEVTNIKNPSSVFEISGFELQLFDQLGNIISSTINMDSVSLMNATDGSSLKIAGGSSRVGDITSYNITFPLYKNVSKTGGIFITFPLDFLFLDEKCTVKNFQAECHRIGQTTIFLNQFVDDLQLSDIEIFIPLVQNSQTNTPEPKFLLIETKDTQNKTIEFRQSPFLFEILCEIGCSTCSASSSNCMSCLTNYYFLENTCVEKCPLGFGAVNNSCMKCSDANCLDCLGSASSCRTCNEGFQVQENQCMKKEANKEEDKTFLNTSGAIFYFLILLFPFVFLSVVAILCWLKTRPRSYFDLIGIIVSLSPIIEILGLSLLIYCILSSSHYNEIILLGLFWLIHLVLQVYGNVKSFSAFTGNSSFSCYQTVNIYVSKYISFKTITHLVIGSECIYINRENKRVVILKLLMIMLISSLQLFFLAIFCCSLLTNYQNYPNGSIYFLYEYAIFCFLDAILTLFIFGKLLPELKNIGNYQRLMKPEVELREQNQDFSLSIKKSSPKKAQIFFNKANPLARDINFTGLRNRFGEDFSEIKRLLNYFTPKALLTKPLNKVRSVELYLQKEIERQELYKAFSENPGKVICYSNNWKISSFEYEEEPQEKFPESCEEIRLSTRKAMPIKWKYPKPSKFLMDYQTYIVDKSQ